MKILGVETSCDETAVAVVENGTKVLSNIVASSIEVHKKYGGIVPEQAAREQLKSILPVISESLEQAKVKLVDIDAIAVTIGPGLLGSLLVGVETAKTFACVLKKPIVPVNHLHGHIYGCWVDSERVPEFPAIVLIVSGGHTELVLMEDHGKYKFIGGTRDDAAGEAFDKTARLLGLGYPGGPEIAACAAQLPISLTSSKSLARNNYQLPIKLPRPMLDSKDFDFSFSGLKTAVLREVQKQKEITEEFKIVMAYEIQEAITDVLVEKTLRAVNFYLPSSVLVVGGVSANKKLREKMQESIKNLFIPPVKYCTDNASYIASCAFYNYNPIPWQKICADPGLEI